MLGETMRKSFLLPILAAQMCVHAQSPAWNDPTCTSTTLVDDNGEYRGMEYTNWQWTDPSGVTHHFDGKTDTYPKYRYYPDGRIVQIGETNTRLVNVRATDGTLLFLNAVGGNATVSTVTRVLPKFQVVSVIYAPPGAGSNVNYSQSSVLGTTTSINNSFTNAFTLTARVGGAFFGLIDGTTTYSTSYSYTVDSSNAITHQKTTTSFSQYPGPASSNDGINHDYDIIWVNLNPQIFIRSTAPNAAEWTLGIDPTDTAVGADSDIIPLYVYQLKDPSRITDPEITAKLERRWAGPNAGLNASDFATILGRNPFWNDGKTGSLPAFGDARFIPVAGGIFSYAPPPPGGQPFTQGYSLEYQDGVSSGTSASDSYSVGSRAEFDVNIGFKASMSWASQYTWMHTTRNNTSTLTGQKASFTLRGPESNYTGPIQVKVFQDRVYGSFLFSFIR